MYKYNKKTTLGPNASLIGAPESRYDLMTPCLVLDLDILDRNISMMAEHCKKHDLIFRPHAKSHKCVDIAERQIKSGAIGISVANIGEAEVFASSGISDILITSPVIGERKLNRLLDLLAKGYHVISVIDSLTHANQVKAIAAKHGLKIPIYLDIDMGRHRTGASLEQSIAIGEFLHLREEFDLCGVQAYAGHLSHEEKYELRLEGALQAKEHVDNIIGRLSSKSVDIGVVAGGSTGTIHIDTQLKRINELQYGSYIFMDVEYDVVDLDGYQSKMFEPSLFVLTTIVSKNWPYIATGDAGHKHFASKYANPMVWGDNGAKLTYEPRSDEHGRVEVVEGEDNLHIGERLECYIPHCDPTVNLYNQYHVVRKNNLVDIWPVHARGAF